MCDKQVYRAPLQERRYMTDNQEDGVPFGGQETRSPSSLGNLRIFMDSFVCIGSHRNSIDVTGKMSVQETAALAREGLLPMHKDDRSALLAWVQAKQDLELRCRAGT